MIDIFNKVYTNIKNALATDYPDVFISGEKLNVVSELPCVSVVEADNSFYLDSLDSSEKELHAQIMYEVEVYSAKTFKKKTEARNIFKVIDDEFRRMGFVRTMANAVDNIEPDIYRFVGRFEAIVGDDEITYRR